MIPHEEIEIQEWIYGIVHGEPEPSGDFLHHFAQAVIRADAHSYTAMHSSIVAMMKRFPKYKCVCKQ